MIAPSVLTTTDKHTKKDALAVEPGSIAVLFLSGRNSTDPEGYNQAAHAMIESAAKQDGYLGFDSVRESNGVGIFLSWWRDEAAAVAWRHDSEHTLVRERGRAIWLDWYRIIITTVERAYDWTRPA